MLFNIHNFPENVVESGGEWTVGKKTFENYRVVIKLKTLGSQSCNSILKIERFDNQVEIGFQFERLAKNGNVSVWHELNERILHLGRKNSLIQRIFPPFFRQFVSY